MAKIKISEKTATESASIAAGELVRIRELLTAQFDSEFKKEVEPIVTRLGIDYDRYREILLDDESEQSIAEYIASDIELGFSDKYELDQ